MWGLGKVRRDPQGLKVIQAQLGPKAIPALKDLRVHRGHLVQAAQCQRALSVQRTTLWATLSSTTRAGK
jgi:hypothetical protein